MVYLAAYEVEPAQFLQCSDDCRFGDFQRFGEVPYGVLDVVEMDRQEHCLLKGGQVRFIASHQRDGSVAQQGEQLVGGQSDFGDCSQGRFLSLVLGISTCGKPYT